MTSSDAYATLRGLKVPVIETADAAAALGMSSDAAQKILARLVRPGLLKRVFHGLWAIGDAVDPLLLTDYLTAPLPSYVSLQTALYHHGLISQVPAVIYAVTLGRARRLHTAVATFSIHHVTPAIFGGFEVGASGIKLATPEKAIFDVLYLSGKRTREFSRLPELDLPRSFRWSVVRSWLDRVTFSRDRTIIEQRIAKLRAG
jgi:predicted transcriptional regulator of viral defense system